MERRPALGAVAVVLALGLFAFPLVSQPADPAAEFRLEVDPIDHDRPPELTIRYENLTAESKTLVDQAIGRPTSVVATLEDAPVELVRYGEEIGGPSFLVRGEQYYRFSAHVYDPGPSGDAVLLRLGTLLGSVVLGCVGGYVLVDEY